MPTLELDFINGSPVFAVASIEPRWQRIHGHIVDPVNRRYVFPAYPPFGQTVVKDLATVAPDIAYSPAAAAHRTWLATVDEKIAKRELPALTWDKAPFAHQLEALTHIYYNPRYALLYDAGLGKTKILLDLLRLLPGERAIVITPKITVRNWVDEAAKHAPMLRVAAIDGTVKRKRKRISGYKNYDLLVMSYGTARLLASPQITTVTAKQILAVKAADPSRTENSLVAIAAAIKGVPSQERQTAYVLAWALGMSVAAVARAATQEIAGQVNWLDQVDYKIIIADESQRIKEGSSQQTKAAIYLSKKAYRRYLSSGTAILGDPRDIHTQFKFLSPAVIPEDWRTFDQEYIVRAAWNPKMVIGFKNMDLLNKRIQKLSISKRKEDCLDLPERRIIDVAFELSDKQKKLYNALVNLQIADLTKYFSDPENATLEVQTVLTRLGKLSQIASGFLYTQVDTKLLCTGCKHLIECVKASVLPYTKACKVATDPPPRTVEYFTENPRLELLEETLEKIFEVPSAKVIVWAWYEAELAQIKELFDRRKWTYTGPASSASRTQSNITDFQGPTEPRAWVAQEATGIGITLTRATYMIYYSIDFAPEPYLQSLDRNYRMGQTQKVTVYRLIGAGTLDAYKIQALDQKRDLGRFLTKNLACATCPKRDACLADGIEMYDPGCMYQRSVTRIVAKARLIDDETDSAEDGSVEDHSEGIDA